MTSKYNQHTMHDSMYNYVPQRYIHVRSTKHKYSFLTVTRVIIVIVIVISLGSNRNIIYYIGPICPRNSNSNILLFCVIDPKSVGHVYSLFIYSLMLNMS